MNISTLLIAAAKANSDRPAIAVGRTLRDTYAQLLEKAARVSTALGALGARPGARVAIVSKNSPEYMPVMWGTWLAGCCIVPVNSKLHPKEIAYILESSGTSICLADEELAGSVRHLTEDSPVRTITIGGDEYDALLRVQPAQAPVNVSRDEPAWLFYTSGTTGRPKGATLTHGNLMAMTLRNFADLGEIGCEDSIIHVAPFSHASGLFSLAYVAKAALHVLPEGSGFSEQELASLIEHHGRATVFLAPTMLNRFVSHPAAAQIGKSRLNTVIYGGAPMYVQDLKKALSVLGPCLLQGYGQGETPNTICYLDKRWHAATIHPRYEQILGSVGIARTGVEVRIADEQGKALPAGEIGEVTVRSDVVMKGYWNDPQATAKSLRDGWLFTGDVGSMDADGFLTLRDRSKDVIISGGSNIYPREVEEILLRHPAVLEASVIGIPSQQWGEEVLAFVVPKSGAQVDTGELDALCLDNVARFKRPKAYRFVSSLPKNNYGKVLKTQLREMAAQPT